MSPGPLTQQVFIPHSTVPTFPAFLCGARVPEVTTPCVNLLRSSTKAPFPLLHCSVCPGQRFWSSFCLLLPIMWILPWWALWGADATASVAINSSVCFLLMGLFAAAGVGYSVQVAHALGGRFVPCQNCGASSSQRSSADGDGGSCLHAPFVLVYSSVAGR